ncbi:beta-lactamase [Seminavis robusta]|uniref:Beta-lactamase n=1 Tax=Seminavis robusta TaxID=568900 RepID=A0A9N8D6P3_9STRA|nr:beta-lactamase [Seminavis robusta]|eukprot:Sro1_g000790.1 beta-lactamase (491) ;mRNA; f:216319-217791
MAIYRTNDDDKNLGAQEIGKHFRFGDNKHDTLRDGIGRRWILGDGSVVAVRVSRNEPDKQRDEERSAAGLVWSKKPAMTTIMRPRRSISQWSNKTMLKRVLPLLFWLVAQLIPANAATVDLSTSWAEGTLYNRNKAYCTLQASLAPCSARGYVVIQDGLLVAEGYTDGNDRNGKYDAWSATKSWSTFFVGVLVDQGKVSISETLNDIFNDASDWEGVGESNEKKSITVEELLTMTSGLVPGACQDNNGQETIQQVLNHVDYDGNQRGRFNYIGQTHILSRIILRRSGQSPREFAKTAGIFTKLGISDSDYEWDTFGGIEGSAYGLKSNPRILAKLGQLYLQNGEAASGDQLVASSWVAASETNQLAGGDSSSSVNSGFDGYGYQFYNLIDGGSGSLAGAAMAAGAQGQLIVYLPSSSTTIAIMGQGCMGADSSKIFLQSIIDNLNDFAVEQTSCSQSFSYWSYFRQHSTELLAGGLLRGLPEALLGRHPV